MLSVGTLQLRCIRIRRLYLSLVRNNKDVQLRYFNINPPGILNVGPPISRIPLFSHVCFIEAGVIKLALHTRNSLVITFKLNTRLVFASKTRHYLAYMSVLSGMVLHVLMCHIPPSWQTRHIYSKIAELNSGVVVKFADKCCNYGYCKQVQSKARC